MSWNDRKSPYYTKNEWIAEECCTDQSCKISELNWTPQCWDWKMHVTIYMSIVVGRLHRNFGTASGATVPRNFGTRWRKMLVQEGNTKLSGAGRNLAPLSTPIVACLRNSMEIKHARFRTDESQFLMVLGLVTWCIPQPACPWYPALASNSWRLWAFKH